MRMRCWGCWSSEAPLFDALGSVVTNLIQDPVLIFMISLDFFVSEQARDLLLFVNKYASFQDQLILQAIDRAVAAG